MKKEVSYGIIPLRMSREWEVFIIKHQAGHWAFPKGHPEEGETPQESALRELQEEAGLRVKEFMDASPLQEEYFFKSRNILIHKTVYYFMAQVEGEVTLQTEEVEEGKWVPLASAEQFLTFQEARRLCLEVRKKLECI